jgi:hypothetical protein
MPRTRSIVWWILAAIRLGCHLFPGHRVEVQHPGVVEDNFLIRITWVGRFTAIHDDPVVAGVVDHGVVFSLGGSTRQFMPLAVWIAGERWYDETRDE